VPTLLTQAVLFDLDGTLVDSTASVDRSWHQIAQLMGRDPADIVGKYHCMPGNLILQLVDPTLSDDRTRELNQALLNLETTDTFDVTALPGAAAAMSTLPAERWAIVTSCSAPLARARLAAAGLPTPRTIVTADDITHGKPHPEPFLAGSRAVGHPPRDCLVFEDAPAGVTSAQAAGCRVLGMQTTHSTLDTETIKNLSLVTFTSRNDGISVSW
jgi:mannitol-1-/sugar-/sorbitol-6-phosphatase